MVGGAELAVECHRHHLGNKPAVGDGLGGVLVRPRGEKIHLLAAQLPPVGDQLGAFALVYKAVTIAQLGRPRIAVQFGDLAGRIDRDVAHVLHTTGDHDLVGAGGHQGRGHFYRGLRRAAATIQRRRGYLWRVARLEPGISGDVARLFTERGGAADHQIFDQCRLDSRASDQLGVTGAEHCVGVHVPVPPALGMRFAGRSANRFTDVDLSACRSERSSHVVAHQITVPPSTGNT